MCACLSLCLYVSLSLRLSASPPLRLSVSVCADNGPEKARREMTRLHLDAKTADAVEALSLLGSASQTSTIAAVDKQQQQVLADMGLGLQQTATGATALQNSSSSSSSSSRRIGGSHTRRASAPTSAIGSCGAVEQDVAEAIMGLTHP